MDFDITQLPVCSSFFMTVEEAQEAVGYSDKLYWEPGSVLKVHFMNGTHALAVRVAECANEWARYANLAFEFYYAPNSPPTEIVNGAPQRTTDIAIQFWDNGGGQSQIGTLSREVSRKGVASMYLPWSGDRGVVLHEFGHALGLMHEHLNPLAPIQWNRDAVYEYYRRIADWDRAMVDSNVLAVLKLDQSNYTLFDRESIMIYEIPPELTLNGFRVNGNSVLSATDKKFIAEKYPR